MVENKAVASEWHCPWNSSVIDDVVPSYRIILEANFASLTKHVPSETDPQFKWWSCRKILDSQLNDLLKTMEDEWIGPWGCLFLGERLDVESLENLATKLSNCLKSQCDFEQNDNLIKVILSGAPSVVHAEACISQSLLYKGFFGRGGCCGEQRFRAFTDRSEEIASIFASVHSLVLEAVCEDMPIDRQPVILVLDNDVQMLSWESMPILKNQEVYRMPSLLSILQKFDRSHYCSKNSSAFEVNFPCVDPLHAYYLLNPSGDLDYTQQQFEGWFQKQKWEGKAGNIPTVEEMLLALENHDLYLYFGHGSGMQYLQADSFGKLDRCAAAFLMGCCSGSLWQSGSYAPRGAPLHYLFAGSPTVIANLWEVTDKDIDRFAKAMLDSWTQNSALYCKKCARVAEDSKDGKALLPLRRRGCKAKEIAENEKCGRCEEKLRLASFISQARGACRFPTIIGAAVVCYGVPTILKRKQ
ncbi:hypothetical protein KSP40_PGU017653 [Platanthera guangdongensis]|uniref:separase n=1 Tax=Platanthera guangdongensis TaxID=2320717 RepID=A0ABR2MYK5_9ASPA